MVANDYYVYRLVDRHAPAAPGQGVFYIGKGRGQRFADHFVEARAAEAVREELRSDLERLPDTDEAATTAKIDRINELLARPGSIRVDIVSRDLSEQAALAIEAAAIDIIGIDHLTNRVRGHHSQCQPLRALEISEKAQNVALTDDAIVVPVGGVWAPGDRIEGLSTLDEQAVWENACQRWPMSAKTRKGIEDRSEAGDPVLLVAVHRKYLTAERSSPSVLAGIVMGEWYVRGAESCGDGHWRFVRHELPPVRKYFHSRLLTDDGTSAFRVNQGTVHSAAFKEFLNSGKL